MVKFLTSLLRSDCLLKGLFYIITFDCSRFHTLKGLHDPLYNHHVVTPSNDKFQYLHYILCLSCSQELEDNFFITLNLFIHSFSSET